MTSTVVPFEAGPESRPRVLPEFATADWLRANHHLMKADLRKLAAAMANEYPEEWTADGSDEPAFWRAVHDQAERWTWFLWLFENRILTLFGRVKGRKKQLVPQLLNAAGERARELHPLGRHEEEPHLLDDLETLWQAGEHLLVAQVVWSMSCLEDAESSYMVADWRMEPLIDDLIGDAVHRARYVERPDRADLVERLERGSPGPHLEKLAERAEAECSLLDKEVISSWRRLKEHVAGHEEYGPALEALSMLVLDVEITYGELKDLAAVRENAVARCRRAELFALLKQATEATPDALGTDTASLTDRITKIAKEGPTPLVFPDPEWEQCRNLAESFRAALVDPGEQQLALREASRRYAEDPSAANRDALHAAMAAERDTPRSIMPAANLLDQIVVCLAALAERFGRWTEDDGPRTMPRTSRHPSRVRATGCGP